MSRRMMSNSKVTSGRGGAGTKGHQKGNRRAPSTTLQQAPASQQSQLQQQQKVLIANNTNTSSSSVVVTKEHNNNTKSNPQQKSQSTHPAGCSTTATTTTTLVGVAPQQNNNNNNNKNPNPSHHHHHHNQQQQQQQSNKSSTAGKVLATSTIPPAPSSSPIPLETLDTLDCLVLDDSANPSSSRLEVEPVEQGEDLEVEGELEVYVDEVEDDLEEEEDVEDEEDDDEDEEDDDEEDLEEEDEEYDHEDGHTDDLTEPCERTAGSGGLSGVQGALAAAAAAANNSASYNTPTFLGSSSEEEDDDEGEVDESLERDESDEEEEDDEDGMEPSGFLLPADGDASSIQGIPPDAQARLEAFFEAAGFTDGKLMSDPENLRKLTLTVSSALGEASAAINRMRDSQRKSIEEGRNDSMEEGDSLLALACSSGYFELARVLLAMGANVDDRGSKGDLTPLMDAASQGHLEIVKLLISHGADVNAQSACGNSPLMYACSAGHEDIVRELLKAGARVEDNNENGHTPLMEAASSGHVSVAKILLEHGAGINTHSNEFKESALTVACYKGHLEMVRFLLEAGADQQHKTDEMHTALMEASMDGHVEVARLLLDSGAQVNMPADSFESPLTLAACGGHVELAELLIERGANIEEVNDEGYTPLMEAAREGHLAVVKCLLKNTATINAQTEETHETALTLAACGGFLDVVDTLCHHGADIELGASTPLMEAAQEGHYQVVKYLLDRGADISRQTQTGDTALSYACENGHVDVVELLIEKGADPEHLSEGGRTPLMKACRGGHGDVIKFLLSKGADVNRQTASNDHTPLSLACAGGHIAAVEILLAAGANPYHKLKDNSTMIIEAARGGHTSVIRALLDHAPNRGNEKGGTPGHGGKQQAKGTATNQSGQTQQKTQAVDSSKTGANSNQGKSVLRKSRSTSTLDSSVQKTESVGPSGEGKSKPLPPMTSIPADSPLLKNLTLPLGDGRPQVSSSEDIRKKPVPVPTPVAAAAIVEKNSNGGNRKTATPSSSSAVPPPNVCTECNAKTSADQPHGHHVHVKRSADALPVSPGGGSSSTATTSVSGPSTSSSSSSGTAASASSGPPLVPSQVTAATAISERPKAKANKPSARKQVQLQQQIQQQLQSQQLRHSGGISPTGSDKTVQLQHGSPNSSGVSSVSSAGTSPSGSGNAGGVLVSAAQEYTNRLAAAAGNGGGGSGSPTALKIAGPPNPSFITAPTLLQMQVQQVRGGGKCELALSETHFTLDAKQLMQIFTQHHQSQLIYKGDHKFDCFDGGIPTETPGEVIDFAQVIATGTKSGMYPLPGSPASMGIGLQLPASACGPPGSGVSAPGTTTTTTTTTVVVTHGNGETETIIEGDNLPPGTNEMIMSAAAAAFPIDCYSMPGGALASSSSSTGGQVQVQSYQLNSPAGLSVGMGVSGDLVVAPGMSPLTTTTMHTTTIINSASSGNFQPQILLPHPPPLPAAISAAAVAAGLIPPSGAPPEGPVQRPVQSQAKSGPSIPLGKVIQVQGGSATPTTLKDKVASPVKGPVTITQGTQATTLPSTPTATVPVLKKQTAKRTRPFSQGPNGQVPHGACSNNQKGGHSVASTQTPLSANDKAPKALDVDSATESNGETSLSIAAGQGHYEVVEFLLSRKAHIEHRDKKGCTPLILAADGGHEKVVELLLNHGSDIEAQSERTKDTALSLACTKGRYEVVELLLKRGSNKEHRNVSDYTPLSLAASGGFVNIIKLLLQYGAEINSRTGSKLGISPLMLAAMNGNTAAVKLLLDMGSDINAQIETNKNTALTLACFQGRHEVVQLLLDRKANLEHRAKTGLTPLMEAANGGYVEVGKVLIEKGADVNALPVPATRDTALTIAADKGHNRFVEMLILSQANTDVRNKKGCTPLWLACNGGHLDVAQALQKAKADIDAQDNRRISCLMAAFKRGHVKIVRWIVKHVKQFPNDQEMSRYFLSLTSEPELLKRAQQCMEYIKQAKDKQAVEASKNANILLEELELERSREESKRLAAAKRREKKKKKKQEKKHQYSPSADNDDDRDDDNDEDDDENDDTNEDSGMIEFMDSGIEVNSLGSNSSSAAAVDHKKKGQQNNIIKGKSNKENLQQPTPQKQPSKQAVNNARNMVDIPVLPSEPEVSPTPEPTKEQGSKNRKKKSRGANNKSRISTIETVVEPIPPVPPVDVPLKQTQKTSEKENANLKGKTVAKSDKEILKEKVKEVEEISVGKVKKDKKGRETVEDKKNLNEAESHNKDPTQYQLGGKGFNTSSHGAPSNKKGKADPLSQGPEPLMGISLNPSQLRKGPFEQHERESHGSHTYTAPSGKPVTGSQQVSGAVPVKTGPGRKDDGWKEVTRSCPSSRSKKVIVPSSVISRVIGRGGCNINAIREATGAHIEVEKQQKGQVQPERTIQIKGSVDATKQAYTLISALMTEPDVDIKKLIPQQRVGGSSSSTSSGGASSSTPTPILCANAFPIIGSASTPLPPIGQSMTVVNSSGAPVPSAHQLNANTTTSVPIEINKGFNSGKSSHMKGSPTSKNVLSSSVSPPLTSSGKSGSPPIKKPTVVSSDSASHTSATNNSNFEIGNFSLSEVNTEAYNKSYPLGMIGKRSMVFTPSAAAVSANTSNTSSTTSSFASKLNQQGHHNNSSVGHEKQQTWDNRQRHPTPTSATGVKTPTSFGGMGVNVNSSGSSSTPPPVVTNTENMAQNGSHPSHNQQSHRGHIHNLHNQNQSLGDRQQIPSVLQSFVTGSHGHHNNNAGVVAITERVPKESDGLNQQMNGPSSGVVDPSKFGNPAVVAVLRNLAPGSNPNAVIGSNRSNAGSERSSSEASNQDQQPPPLEYSPFNYTFSKTTGWFPGDLAVRESTNSNGGMSQQFGASNLMTSLATGGSTSALSASRAMNFASVAASGISSSMSTTTAQMSQTPIGQGVQNNGSNMVSGMVAIGKSNSLADGHGHHESEVPKADASKAPGYRGNTTMGSPVLRMPSNLPNSNYNMEGPLSSHFAAAAGINQSGLNHNMINYNQVRQNYGPAGQPGMTSQYPTSQDMASNMMNAHQQSLNGGNPMMYPNNRLNPRAPSFMAKVQPGQQQQQPPQLPQTHGLQGSQQPVNSAFASTQQNQYNNMQQYKNMGGSGMTPQYGGRAGMNVGPVRSAVGVQGVGSGWTGYGGNIGNGGVDESMAAFQGLTALAGPGGMMDPSALLSGIESLHDNQNAMKMEDRRLPRPIGGERTWKSGNGGSIGNMATFSALDCLDAGPLAQPISLPSANHGVGNSNPQPQGNSWLTMYGHAGSPQQTGFPASGQQQQQQPHGGLNAHGPQQPGGPGPRGGDRGIGRRYMEDMDANRMLEFQQMYDGQQRMMNGGSIPPMMHMPNAPPHPNPGMYPFGLEHLDQQSIPKLDQQWDSHLLMDDKHMQQGGWGGGSKWGN